MKKEALIMCQSIPSVKNEALGNALDWMKWVSQVMIFPAVAGILAFLWYGEQRMDRLEMGQQSRFTAEDGLAAWQAIHEIQREIAVTSERLQKHLEETVPANQLVKTEEFYSYREKLENRLTKLETGK